MRLSPLFLAAAAAIPLISAAGPSGPPAPPSPPQRRSQSPPPPPPQSRPPRPPRRRRGSSRARYGGEALLSSTAPVRAVQPDTLSDSASVFEGIARHAGDDGEGAAAGGPGRPWTLWPGGKPDPASVAAVEALESDNDEVVGEGVTTTSSSFDGLASPDAPPSTPKIDANEAEGRAGNGDDDEDALATKPLTIQDDELASSSTSTLGGGGGGVGVASEHAGYRFYASSIDSASQRPRTRFCGQPDGPRDDDPASNATLVMAALQRIQRLRLEAMAQQRFGVPLVPVANATQANTTLTTAGDADDAADATTTTTKRLDASMVQAYARTRLASLERQAEEIVALLEHSAGATAANDAPTGPTAATRGRPSSSPPSSPASSPSAPRFNLTTWALESSSQLSAHPNATRLVRALLAPTPPPPNSSQVSRADVPVNGSPTLARRRVDVAWHVLHDGERGNVTGKQLSAQMEVLKRAFSPHGFDFTLVNVSRSDSAAWYAGVGRDGRVEEAAKRALHQGDLSTLNVYTAALDETGMGHATFPWDAARLARDRRWSDGVVVLDASLPYGGEVGYDLGMTMVHAVGHWLGLSHPFQGGCASHGGADSLVGVVGGGGAGAGDGVDDTPPQLTPTNGCPVNKDTCNGGGQDSVRNFMDFSTDACMQSFTLGQAIRMLAAAEHYRGL